MNPIDVKHLNVWAEFKSRFAPGHRILEVGTKRQHEHPTHARAEFPLTDYVLSDFESGLDVDVVADCHRLNEVFEPNSFDGFIARSVFEHLEKPWVAAASIYTILKPGAWFFIQTHQTFPLHGYPDDYFRFTGPGLKSLFDWGINLQSSYEFPCTITPPEGVVWNPAAPSYLNVYLVGQKP